MKKKFLLIGGALAVGALALSSCGSKTRERKASLDPSEKTTDATHLDVSLTYSKKGVFITPHKPFFNPIENVNYTADSTELLPVWKTYQSKLSEKLGVTLEIRDAIKHGDSVEPSKEFKTDRTKGFVSTNANNLNSNIDVYQNTTENINSMGASNECIDLSDYFDYLPNFKAYLDANPIIEDQIQVNGHIYYTPYMDGSDYYERMFQMDAYVVETLLDSTSPAFDETPAVNENRLKKTAVDPFIDETKNYASSSQKVNISVDGKSHEVTVKQTTNIIKQQNDLLATAGTTGKQLAEQYIAYLNEAYGDIKVDGVKVYDKLSKVFIGESAIYNTDDLIGLLRVFRANPSFISGNKNDTVYPIVPRTNEDSRIEYLIQIAGTLYGVQGLASEKDRLFFATDGTMNDAATAVASYEALDKLAALYDEGIIAQGFHSSDKTVKWAENNFARKSVKAGNPTTAGYALMEYDYTATQSAFNERDETGIGVPASSVETGYHSSKLGPVLAPLTYWATEKYDHSASLSSREGKTLIRYYEEQRSLKTESWCIPSNTDNLRGALELLDYMMSKEGQVYNDFCSEEYWAKEADGSYSQISYGTDTTPMLNSTAIEWYASYFSGNTTNQPYSDFWTWCRGCLGTTFGLGYIRTSTIDYQSTNTIAKEAAKALYNATYAGTGSKTVQYKPNISSDIKFATSVPAAGYQTVSDEIAATYDAITQFWNSKGKGLNNTAYGWVKLVVSGKGQLADSTVLGTLSDIAGGTNYTYKDVKDQFTARNTTYLKTHAEYFSEVGDGYGKVPAYAKTK